MLDIGVTKLAIIGGIALIVIGPERLPGLAKTLGTLLGRATIPRPLSCCTVRQPACTPGMAGRGH